MKTTESKADPILLRRIDADPTPLLAFIFAFCCVFVAFQLHPKTLVGGGVSDKTGMIM